MIKRDVKLETTSLVGFLIGMSAWSISFMTLILGYLFYRLRFGQWLGQYMDTDIYLKITLNTGLLVLSSWVLHAFTSEKKKHYFYVGFLSGGLFLVGQWEVWQVLMKHGLTFKGSLAGNFLYLLTGFHALHVLLGLGILLMYSIKLLSKSDLFASEQNFDFVLKFWDLLLFFWLVLVGLVFILK